LTRSNAPVIIATRQFKNEEYRNADDQSPKICHPAGRGLQTAAEPEGMNFLLSLASRVGATKAASFSIAGRKAPQMRVLDSIHENGAKLVEASPEDLPAMRSAAPGVRIVPEVLYFREVIGPPAIIQKVKLAAVGVAAAKIQIGVVSRTTGAPVKGATVVAFTDFEAREGAQAVTNAQGKAQLALGAASKRLERLYVFPLSGAWPFLTKNITITSGTQIKVEPIAFPFVDCVRHFLQHPRLTVGTGVTVGIVDSGVGPRGPLVAEDEHVTGENPTDFSASNQVTAPCSRTSRRGDAPRQSRSRAGSDAP
jgi:subtilisin